MMIIELSYWDMFWIGAIVGWILCWYVPVLLNTELPKIKPMNSKERQESYDMKTLGYLPIPDFKYQPTKYFKHVPVKELRLGNQGEMPSKPTSEMPSLKKPNKSPPLPDYNPNK